MARVIGSEAGGYATILPTENYIGQALQNVEQNAFKYREEKRLEEAKKAALAKAQQDALDKQREEEANDLEKIGAIRAKDSGISGIDSAVSNGLASAREEYINYKRAYRKSGDKNDLLKMSTALNRLHAISTIPDSYKKAADDLRERVANGTVSRSDEKRIENFAKQIEQGYVVPKFGPDNTMSFDVFERDEKGQLSKQAIKNMKGEEVIANLTPRKIFDYNKNLKEVQGLYGGNTTTQDFALAQSKNLPSNMDLFHDIADQYGIDEEPGGGYSPENAKVIQDRYYKDVFATLSENYDKEKEARAARENQRQEEELRMKKEKHVKEMAEKAKEGKDKESPFEPPVDVVTKGGTSTDLGVKIAKGDKILSPTYKQGKSGPVNGVVLRPDGTYVFSVSERKNEKLNAQGLAKQKAWMEDEANAGEEFEPDESDYQFPASKPTAFTSTKNSNVLSKYVRAMLNPATGKHFQNFKEYANFYNKYKPTASAGQSKEAKRTPAKTQTKAPAKKVYAGVDENGKIIWK